MSCVIKQSGMMFKCIKSLETVLLISSTVLSKAIKVHVCHETPGSTPTL